MTCSTPGLPVHHQLPEFTQTQLHRVSDAIQPSHPLPSPSPPSPIPPSIRVFSNQSTLRMRWPKYWSFGFSIISSKEIPGLISLFFLITKVVHVHFTMLKHCVCVKSLQSYPILRDPMDCCPPGSSSMGILQARILEWVAMPFSRGSSPPCIAGGFFTAEPLGKPIQALPQSIM